MYRTIRQLLRLYNNSIFIIARLLNDFHNEHVHLETNERNDFMKKLIIAAVSIIAIAAVAFIALKSTNNLDAQKKVYPKVIDNFMVAEPVSKYFLNKPE